MSSLFNILADKPTSSPSPSFDNIQSTSVRVTWTRPDILPSYQIKYGTSSLDQTIDVSYDKSDHTITGLSVCTSYKVAIQAVSKIGDASLSDKRSLRTASECKFKKIIHLAYITHSLHTFLSRRV